MIIVVNCYLYAKLQIYTKKIIYDFFFYLEKLFYSCYVVKVLTKQLLGAPFSQLVCISPTFIRSFADRYPF